MLEIHTLQSILFFILALFMLGGSLTLIGAKQTYISAFGFLITMLGLGGMFALLENQFLALAQIIVSVGAVVVLSILTILTINAKEENLPKEPRKILWILSSIVLVSPFTYLLYTMLTKLPKHFMQAEPIDTKLVGETLFNHWVLPFELVSILLLSAMVGAIIIAKKTLPRGDV